MCSRRGAGAQPSCQQLLPSPRAPRLTWAGAHTQPPPPDEGAWSQQRGGSEQREALKSLVPTEHYHQRRPQNLPAQLARPTMPHTPMESHSACPCGR